MNTHSARSRFLDQLFHHESAATIADFASTPLAETTIDELSSAIAHLRDILGDKTYEELTRTSQAMSRAEIVTYACDQIDQARAELKAMSNSKSTA